MKQRTWPQALNRLHALDSLRMLQAPVFLVCLLAGNALAQRPAERLPISVSPMTAAAGKIDFPPNLVPQIPSSLPIIKLTPQAPPEAFLRDTLGKLGVKLETIQPLTRAPHLTGRGVSEQLTGVVEQNRVRAYWHRQTGEAEIFPQLEKLRGEKFVPHSNPHLQRAVSLAQQVFSRPEILARDVTQFTIGEPRPLVGSTAQRAPNTTRVTESEHLLYLTYVPVVRSVGGHRVYGTGSRALLAMGNDGAIHGFLRRWKTGSSAGNVHEARSSAQVHDALTKMLQPMASNADVHVLSVEVAYYDGDADSILPVYRVSVRVHSNALAGVAASRKSFRDLFIVRYMAFGNGQLPARLAQGPGPMPMAAPKGGQAMLPGEVREGDPTVGRYVVRDAQWGFVDEANAFWNGLDSPIWGGSGLFTNSQYYWAHDWMYTTNEASFVNSVNVAMTEAHGDWWWFSTESNCCDAVDLTTLPPSQGYGAANHGSLDYWFIHSCEVVPSAADAPCATDPRPWWTPWFNVFQGLHSVLGSRTSMFFDSGAVNFPTGLSLRLGVPVVSAWFNATISAASNAGTGAAHCGNYAPLDRPSTISVCGHENDSVYNTDPLPPAGCLINFWQPD